MNQQNLKAKFFAARAQSENLCLPLITEDFSVQPSEFASPPKWHLAHVSWFWETFVLSKYLADYQVFHEDFSFLFNSYYNHIGKRVLRPTRGLMTRPSIAEVLEYRAYINKYMAALFDQKLPAEVLEIIDIGINHEEQHQELLVYDIKYILGNQPTFPVYGAGFLPQAEIKNNEFLRISGGLYSIGHSGENFSFDNELGAHQVFLQDFEIAQNLVTNADFLEFIVDGGYQNFAFWHDEGWHWVQENKIEAPLYWHKIDGHWHNYTLQGLSVVNPDLPVMHLSFYEAFAFAEWRGMRLPTEFEWEVAAAQLNWGQLWEWTGSAYLPYPQFKKAPGALGEYNGKFMVNQMVLRGASVATPAGHSRPTYRNFFQANMRWQFCGLRLAR